ncbi:D-malate degradation protein R [Hartmannibacter diazotrophicus]|uniref:D-malate degradation protein R n=1 Tax=Hartmannibacter diazotrophicus TaxID=1482074 RepID=A0A2C9D3S8_9HYPH|nr:LysR substrate-binding domain-containing protein [Hartmannibacter diazotrophicus]SON54926.1 D-malate degradation protein R [Hartmannibacter diazotrophicus]
MNRTDLPALALFAEVARTRSFRLAARNVRLSPSAVSHGIAALEERIGVRLLTRTTRSVGLTEAGERLLHSIDPALTRIDEAVNSLAEDRERPAGRLRITAPRMAGIKVIVPHAAAFAERYPEVMLDVDVSDRFVDLAGEEFDAGIRLEERVGLDMVAVRLSGPMRQRVVATPDYLDRMGRPETPQDLARHRCVMRRFSGGTLYDWEFEKDGRAHVAHLEPAMALTETGLVADVARLGGGLAYVFEDLVRDDLASGRLESVLDDWSPSFPGFFLYYSGRRLMRPALRAYIDFMVERCRH